MNTIQPSTHNRKLEAAAPSKAPWLGMGAALVAAIGAGLCCAGPFIYLVFGVSAAGFARLPALQWLQLPLSVVSVACLIMVFWHLYISKRPSCLAGPNRYLRLVFMGTAVVSAVLLGSPYLLAWWLV